MNEPTNAFEEALAYLGDDVQAQYAKLTAEDPNLKQWFEDNYGRMRDALAQGDMEAWTQAANEQDLLLARFELEHAAA
jgi:hypothetical protein